MSILLVEDDIWLAQLYKDVLVKEGFEVSTVMTAAKALEQLDKKLPDLMVLDMFLPAHNGLELLHEVASYSDTAKIPVVVLSSAFKHDFGMSDLRWREYGVVEYLYKPITKPVDLVACVKKQLIAEAKV
jgi:two-component system, OmpR family, response regulator ResD